MMKLSKTPNLDQLRKCLDDKTSAKLGRYTVQVSTFGTETRYGSWERGFKWTRSEYVMLRRTTKTHVRGAYTKARYSADYGRTWHQSEFVARKVRAGKVLLNRTRSQEMAFEGIQRINRAYDPSYRWTR